MALRPPFGQDPFGRSNTGIYTARLIWAIYLGSAILALLILPSSSARGPAPRA